MRANSVDTGGMIDIQKFPETWCRMWSEDAALAHELLTDDARQWATARPLWTASWARLRPKDSYRGTK